MAVTAGRVEGFSARVFGKDVCLMLLNGGT